MNNKLNIPETLKVGFQERDDTYSGFLAYVVYLKKDKTIAKETSWKGWCSSKIPTKELPNEPIEGFVLNKKAGGYASGWNHRQTYCRVWDPRGWEVEISIPNLLYILQECNCEKGKGLSGKFVYAWDGKDLVLLPTSCEDYKQSKELIDKTQTIKISDLVVGKSYFSVNNKIQTYLGARNVYIPTEGKFKQHLFLCGRDIIGYKSITNKFYYQTDDEQMSLAECADYIDKIKDNEAFIEKGITVKSIQFLDNEFLPISFYDHMKEILNKNIEEIKKYRDICLNNPTKENYKTLYECFDNRHKGMYFDFLVKESDTKWLSYRSSVNSRNYYYYTVSLSSHVYVKTEEQILENAKKLTDEKLYSLRESFEYHIQDYYEIEKNGKITISKDWHWQYNNQDNNEYKNIKSDTPIMLKRNKSIIELTLSNGNKIKIKYPQYENGSEKTYRLIN